METVKTCVCNVETLKLQVGTFLDLSLKKYPKECNVVKIFSALIGAENSRKIQ